MNASQFSIIIPTYNRAYILPTAIASVQNQTHHDWELIVVDDGSIDDTRKVMEKIAATDTRVRYIFQNNAAASAARNHGWREAHGEVVVYLDSDDTMYPELLEKIADVFVRKPEIIFGITNHYRHIVLVDEKNNVVQEKPVFVEQEKESSLQDFYHWKIKTTGSGLFHKRILNPKISWDESLRYLEDWEFIMQCGEFYPHDFYHIAEPLIYYTQKYGIDGMCANATYADWAAAFNYIYHKHEHDPLIQGQTWYPDRVERYTKMQVQFEAGEILPAMYKYFPDFNFTKNN